MRRRRSRRSLVVVTIIGLALGALPASLAGAAPRIDPPAATITASATVDRASNSVDVSGDLTAGGSGVGDESVSLFVRNTSMTRFVSDGSVITGTDGSFEVDVLEEPGAAFLSNGPFVFELRHAASTTAGAATLDLDVTPAPVALSIAVRKTVVNYGATATITGHLTYKAGGSVPSTDVVKLFAASAAEPTVWKGAGSFDLTGDGVVKFQKHPAHNTRYRLTFESFSPASTSAQSVAATVRVRPDVVMSLSPTVLPLGGTTDVSTSVAPRETGDRVTLERLESSRWVPISHSHLGSGSTRTWALTGRHVTREPLRVVRPATTTNAAGTSTVKPLKIEKHAGGKTSAHTFLFHTRDGNPIRWNPCQAIHYRVNLDEAPAHALANVKEALRRVAQPTGMHFVYDGTTRIIPSLHRRQPAPLTIAWATPSQTNYPLGDGVLGEGGGDWESGPGFQAQVVSGYAVLLAHQGLTPGFGSGVTEGALLMHELGHAMGLNHTTESSQIMFPELLPRTATMYGAGDYRGLELLGRSQGCL